MTSERRSWRSENEATFDATVRAAAEQLGIGPLAVAKDYWVCQALRAIATHFPEDVVFKGGTSIEKLRIVERLSEDIDLLVVSRPANDRAGGRLLKAICAAVCNALGQDKDEKVVSGGRAAAATLNRTVYVAHPGVAHLDATEQDDPVGMADPDRILVELGQSGGQHPHIAAMIESILARQLGQRLNVAEFEDLAAFEMQVLHPGRTLLEKLLRVNTFAAGWPANRTTERKLRIGRQFYDIWALLDDQLVLELLQESGLRDDILADCMNVSAQFHGDAPRPEGGFANSPAFDGANELGAWLREGHDQAVGSLYFGASPSPTFDAVLERVHQRADLL